jgi:hypothetical protein
MKKGKIFVSVLCLLAVLALVAGCGEQNDPNKTAVKIEISAPAGRTFHGYVKAENPSGAGFASKNLEITAPGSVEFKCGTPSAYDVRIYDWCRDMKLKLFIDGKEQIRGQGILINDDPREEWSGMFELKKK